MEKDLTPKFPDIISIDRISDEVIETAYKALEAEMSRRAQRSRPATPELKSKNLSEVVVLKPEEGAWESQLGVVKRMESSLDPKDRFGARRLQTMEDGSVVIHSKPWQ